MSEWPDGLAEKVLHLWNQGHSAGQIARVLQAQGFDFSRNAVIGKLYRMEGKGTGRVVTRSGPAPITLKDVAMAPVDLGAPGEDLSGLARAPVPKNPRGGVDILDLDAPEDPKMCRYIVHGRGARARFCGHETLEGRPYCARHWARLKPAPQKKPGAEDPKAEAGDAPPPFPKPRSAA
jgi:hypothetical protein